jgi:hypothetical protein
MDTIRSLRPAPAIIALLLCACFQRVTEIRAVEASDGVAFEVRAIEAGLTDGRSFRLLDLTVTRRECDEDCTMWFIVRDTAQPDGGMLEAGRIVYGDPPGGMAVRTPARAFSRGSYAVSATVQQYDAAGALMRSLSLDGEFSIDQDGSGRQRVRGQASTGE